MIFSRSIPPIASQNWRDARGLHARHAAGRQSRRRLHGRQAVSRHAGRPRAGLRLQDRQAALGDDHRRSEDRRDRAGRADRLERTGLHRQCRRRHQGREGAHVRARRQDRQDRLGILSGAEDAGRYRRAGRKAPTPLDASTWKNAAGSPITGGATWTSYTLDPDDGTALRARRQSGARFRAPARARARICIPARSSCSTPRPALTRTHFKIVPKDWHDWDVSNAPALIQTRGGKKMLSVAPKDGHLYGFDLADNALLYRKPVTRIENAEAQPSRPASRCISVPARSAARNGTARPMTPEPISSWSAKSIGARR